MCCSIDMDMLPNLLLCMCCNFVCGDMDIDMYPILVVVNITRSNSCSTSFEGFT